MFLIQHPVFGARGLRDRTQWNQGSLGMWSESQTSNFLQIDEKNLFAESGEAQPSFLASFFVLGAPKIFE